MASDTYGAILLTTANDVGAMLQKKMATPSETYAPAVWAETINLLGKLPEATVSGSIVTFSDGADDVPTKSLIVTIPPTLSGVSSVSETQTGRNLVNGYIDYSNVNKVVEPQFYKAGTYTFSCVRATNINGIYVRKGSAIDLTAESISSKYNTLTNTFTVSEDGYYFIQLYRNTSSPTWEDEPVSNVQLEYGSMAHDYEPYQTPTVYTASLGRTIYGGTADVVNGEGTDGFGKVTDFSALTANGTSSTGAYRYRLNIADCAVYTDRQAISSEPLTFRASFNGSVNEFYNASGYLLIFLSQDNVSDAIAYLSGVSIVYPIVTPTDFTFDGQEINTRLGYNAFWSEQGDMSVTYRRDIDLALQALSGSRGLMMARPPAAAETEETEPEDETTETIDETPEDMEK